MSFLKKAFKSIKKGLKKVTNPIKKFGRQIDQEVRRSGGWELAIGTMGFGNMIKQGAKTVMGAITPKMPELPDFGDLDFPDTIINMPDPQTQGQVQGSIGSAAPRIDLGFTEGSRRKSGSNSKTTRNLRVPLGGLR